MSQPTANAPEGQDARRAQAIDLAGQGRVDEAGRLFDALLVEQPDDVDALNFLAVRAHSAGRPDEALELLSRARAAHPGDATTLVNVGVMLRERDQLDEAIAALTDALRIEPGLYVARLRLGEAMQARGDASAVAAYFGAIMAAQGRGQWLSDATTAPSLRPLVRHAMRVVAGGRRMVFSALIAPLRERHGAAALVRVEKCLAIYLKEIAPGYPDPAQQPKFLYFPDLPTTRFFERELFPWYEPLEAHTDTIRAEMLQVLAEDSGFEPFLGHFDDKLALQDHLRGERGEPAWNAFFFHRHGVRNDANVARCPATIAALEATPFCRVRDHSPEVCFSVLTPGSHILPHRGVTNTRLVTHLPLVVPEGDLALHVSGETMRWQEGRCFTFDDTFEHEAWNRSSETRVVVLLDVWNPYLTEVEREAVAALTAGIGDFNREAGL
jgi:aspartate beta-hydroxylase